MTQRPIMDAGPGLNFFATNRERLLFATLGALCVPESVEGEMLRKARTDPRFRSAERVWSKLPPRLMEVLADDPTDDLARAVFRIAQIPMHERARHRKDLGEVMVVAHAAVAAESGAKVLVLIDDGGGRRLAAAESRRLLRLREHGQDVGSIGLIGTLTVLERAAGGEHLPDRGSMRTLYERLRKLDDGLPPLERTTLMSLPCWAP